MREPTRHRSVRADETRASAIGKAPASRRRAKREEAAGHEAEARLSADFSDATLDEVSAAIVFAAQHHLALSGSLYERTGHYIDEWGDQYDPLFRLWRLEDSLDADDEDEGDERTGSEVERLRAALESASQRSHGLGGGGLNLSGMRTANGLGLRTWLVTGVSTRLRALSLLARMRSGPSVIKALGGRQRSQQSPLRRSGAVKS